MKREHYVGGPSRSDPLFSPSPAQAIDPIIYATPGNRHLVMSNASILTDGVKFAGAISAGYSGGIELTDAATGFFYNTTFQHCRWQGNGGAISIAGGSQVELST